MKRKKQKGEEGAVLSLSGIRSRLLTKLKKGFEVPYHTFLGLRQPKISCSHPPCEACFHSRQITPLAWIAVEAMAHRMGRGVLRF